MFRFFLFVELPWFWLRCYGWVSNRDALTMKRSKCSLIIIIIRIIIIIINNLDNHCTSGGCWRCCDSFSRKSCNVAEDLSLALINKCMYECTYTYLYVIHIMYIQGAPKKMIHRVLYLKSVEEVGFNFSTGHLSGVSESEYWDRSN